MPQWEEDTWFFSVIALVIMVLIIVMVHSCSQPPGPPKPVDPSVIKSESIHPTDNVGDIEVIDLKDGSRCYVLLNGHGMSCVR